VKSRHCPATVSEDFAVRIEATAPKEWEGAAAQQRLASQETGSAKLMSALSRAKEDKMYLVLARAVRFILCVALLFSVHQLTNAQSTNILRGRVTDPIGSAVPNATIAVLRDGQEVTRGNSDAEGAFRLAVPDGGRYNVRVEAQGFAPQTVKSVLIAGDRTTDLPPVTLSIGPLVQQVVVSATGTAIPDTQVGASIAVIDSEQIQTLNKLDILEHLRLVPGAQIMQTGQRGGATSLFIRGGNSDFNKVLVDGIPVNDIGGHFDFAQLANSGLGNLEMLRGSNSVLYGSDALGGVVNVSSKRGTTAIPEFTYAVDGGNFGTLRQDVSVAGALHGFDYFSEFSRFDTQGSLPNNYFHNATVNANLGYQFNSTTSIRATVRHIAAGLGSPNGLDLYGIADDSAQTNRNTYAGAAIQNQTTERWHNSVQFAFAQFNTIYDNPSPTGQSFDPFGSGFPNYLGNVVTIRGANGYSVTGQGILDYGGTYPMIYTDYEARRSVYAQSDYNFFGDWVGVFGFRYEHEDGQGLTRDNYSTFLEGHGSVGHRFFATFGGGFEHNSFFGFAATPRVSMACYLRRPTNAGVFGETKLKFNFGQGIKEASTSQQASSLIALLTPAQIKQYNVQPVGPERSRTFDFGADQRLFNGRSILGVTFYYNNFYDLISFLSIGELISIGVPPDVANSTPIGGAYVNATSQRAKGAEVDYKVDLGHGLLFQGEYTYTDALVTKAFGTPSFNPLFATIPIGAFSPLQGARPFRIAPHSGSLALFYYRKKFNGAFTGYLVGRRDDSTFMYDGYFGNTMLLPNRNLAFGYQKFDISAAYALKPYVTFYASIENLFSQHYAATFGFPALPFAIRSGVRFTLGGSKGWWK
jgi:iron complex outermembrane receptor protein/vitamin B12 transporter